MDNGSGKRLTLEQRKKIQALIPAEGAFMISKLLGYSYGAIHDEIKKNGGIEFYNAEQAHENYKIRKREASRYIEGKTKVKTPLSFAERKLIENYGLEGLTNIEISRRISRGTCLICLEFKRTGGREKYTAEYAQKLADERWKKMLVKRPRKAVETKTEQLETQIERMEAQTEHVETKGELVETQSANIYADRIENLEMQVEILTDQIKELLKR